LRRWAKAQQRPTTKTKLNFKK
jgi:hypothetical protein